MICSDCGILVPFTIIATRWFCTMRAVSQVPSVYGVARRRARTTNTPRNVLMFNAVPSIGSSVRASRIENLRDAPAAIGVQYAGLIAGVLFRLGAWMLT